jgi:hypothetical protein
MPLILLALVATSNVNQAVARGQYFAADAVRVEIIDNQGRPFPNYPASSRYSAERSYVEARRDAEYRIRITNRTGERIGLVIAVDGRNVISGAHSDLKATERMYVLNPHEQQEYSGWRTGRNEVHRFYFTTVDDSYADAWGDQSTLGIIAIAVFAERPQPVRIARRAERAEERAEEIVGGSRSTADLDGAYKSRSQAAAPGTGFGDVERSPSKRVTFEPKRRPMVEYFLKYEWRRMLCKRGVVRCHRHVPRQDPDWETPRPERDESGFAPYPPSKRWWHDR